MVNFVPKTGGNVFKGQTFFSTSGQWSQTANLDDQLRSFGISQADHVRRAARLGASGVIVASALTDLVERSADPIAAANKYLREMKQAASAVTP